MTFLAKFEIFLSNIHFKMFAKWRPSCPYPPVYHIFHDKEANYLEIEEIINWASHHI